MPSSHVCRSIINASLSLSLLFAGAVGAAESYDNCTGFIDSLPAVISTQGTWCLRKNLGTAITSGSTISVTTNNVTIDCNNFKIGGLEAGPGTLAYGISAQDRLNVTVRQCNVRGYFVGVNLVGGSGNIVEDNRFDGNTRQGVRVDGDGSIIRRNLIVDTGGSTDGVYSGIAEGIFSNGDVDILDNTISGVMPGEKLGSSNAVGIESDNNYRGTIADNRIRGLLPTGSTPSAEGIHAGSNGRVVLLRNQIIGEGAAGYNYGIDCNSSSGQMKDNFILGFNYGTTGTAGCTDAGGNVIAD